MLDGLSMLSKVGSGFLAGAGSSVAAPRANAIPSGDSFAAMMGDAWNSTVGSLKTAESSSMMALTGEADTRTVVDAVMSAEQSLQTAIAIRDKIVSAYLEVSRMAI